MKLNHDPWPSPGSWLAMDAKGGLVATWSEYDAMAARFAPNGALLGKKILVSRLPADQNQLYPVVSLLPGGGFVVVWTDTDQRDGSGWGLYGRTFAADGTPVSDDLRINVTTAGHQYWPAIASRPQGPVVVVWNQQTGTAGQLKTDFFARILVPASP